MPKFEKIILLYLICLAVLRFLNLDNIPVFLDEAIYLDDAERVTQSFDNLFISLKDMQFPIMTWILAIINLLTKSFFNLLLSGRIFSVFSDLLATWFIYLIGKQLVGKEYGLLAALFYISLPLNFFHSRQVMLEPLTNLFSLGVVYYVLLLVQEKKPKLKNAIAVCLFFLLAFFTKPLAVVNIIPLFFLPIVFVLNEESIKFSGFLSLVFFKKIVVLFKRMMTGLLPAIAISIIIFIPLSNVVFYDHVNNPSVLSLAFLNGFKLNLWKSFFWMRAYLTDPLLVFSALVGLFALAKKQWIALWLGMWIVEIVILDSYLGMHFFPRHLYSVSVPMAMLAAYGIFHLKFYQRQLASLSAIALLMIPFYMNIMFLTNPVRVLVGEERQAFFEDWPSGNGLKSVAQDLKELSKEEEIVVYTENEPLTVWALPAVFDIGRAKMYSSNDLLHNKTNFFKKVTNEKINKRTYLLLNHYPDIPSDWNFQLVKSYPKGTNREIKLYQIAE